MQKAKWFCSDLKYPNENCLENARHEDGNDDNNDNRIPPIITQNTKRIIHLNACELCHVAPETCTHFAIRNIFHLWCSINTVPALRVPIF